MTNPRAQFELPIRRTVFFSGNVQGVGFRATVCQVAADFEVTGSVKNLLDGRVQILVEGLPEEVDRFIQAVERRMDGFIEYKTETDSTARGEFTGFRTEL